VSLRILRKSITYLAVFTALISNSVFAQADRGTIEGIVSDASGASVADARVQILRIDTNDVISLRTN
jgi:hypothetical protein